MPDFTIEETAGGMAAGVDEAGRGPWCGPVIAAAVILDRAALPACLRDGIDDSKKLTAKRRKDLFAAICDHALVGVGRAEAAEIDAINILQASMLAMGRAIGMLGVVPDLALVDGDRAPSLPCPALPVVKGDAKSLSIAAASIVAKVTRDRIMAELAGTFPGYGWERNQGYGTAEHQEALKRLGVTPHHRRSFKPVIKILGVSIR